MRRAYEHAYRFSNLFDSTIQQSPPRLAWQFFVPFHPPRINCDYSPPQAQRRKAHRATRQAATDGGKRGTAKYAKYAESGKAQDRPFFSAYFAYSAVWSLRARRSTRKSWKRDGAFGWFTGTN